MSAYILRDIDSRLWARVKTRARHEGLSLRALLLALLRAYADKAISVTAAER